MKTKLLAQLLALVLGLCFFVGQASAFTRLGTGTGGTLANTVFIGGTSGNCGTTTATLNPGDVWGVVFQDGNTGLRNYSVTSPDAFGNTWQAAPGKGNQNGAGDEIWYTVVTNTVSSGSTAVCNTNSASFLTTNVGYRPSGTAAFDTNATGQASAGNNVTIGATPTLACPSGGANCDVCVAGATWHAAGTTASDATWNTIAGTGAGNGWVGGDKIVSASTPLSYTGTNTTSANYAGALACFKDTPAAGPTNKKVMMRSIP